jgi:hypothetical protein
MQRNEQHTFETEYEANSHSLVDTLIADIIQPLWMCRTVSSTTTVAILQKLRSFASSAQNAVNNATDVSNANTGSDNISMKSIAFDVAQAEWDVLTSEAWIVSGGQVVTCSPLLMDDMQREQYESYVNATKVSNNPETATAAIDIAYD